MLEGLTATQRRQYDKALAAHEAEKAAEKAAKAAEKKAAAGEKKAAPKRAAVRKTAKTEEENA